MRLIPEHEEINKNHPFWISIFEEVKLRYPFHYHMDAYELTLTLGSSGIRLAGDSINAFEKEDLVLTAPGIPHCWLNNFNDNEEDGEKIMVVVIHFNKHLFSRELLDRKELIPVKELLENAGRGIAFIDPVRSAIKEKILSLNIEQDFSTYIDLYSIFDVLSGTRDYELLSSPGYSYTGRKDEKDKFEKVFDYIFRHFREAIRINEVACLANMNDSAFSHYFKKRTSKSYTDFLNELRLNYAAGQLTHTHQKVADICFDSGFNNLSNFNRVFKKWKNITPNQWRKRTQPIIK